jgi:hypothetical protein
VIIAGLIEWFRYVRSMKNKRWMKDRTAILERLFGYYTGWYDVSPGDMGSGLPLQALCQYRSQSERFILSKKAKLWGVEVNDFLYLFSMPKLDIFKAEECVSFSIEDALPRVKPHKEHMYSFITALFVADEIEEDALKFIRRRRFNKSYMLGLQGSSPLKTAGLDIGKGKVAANNMGRDLCKQIRNICKE